ncbi:helicase-exonuclease AddAB subunit AddA [Listeria ivanovii]|uniref:helicase-exonuclease AddAB subunit AddA n=1 Tax=Listeria ivanovii TaxID=1638 RepID=UPI0003EC78E2|nr:helicase-exonuclease AddAB subunit AddA [Listeria ivanovii]AHI56776.1 ATP-dependent helicase [Listeria ivanovii WSLC3009]AIS66193.1 ATP-dependent helicase [Listeria ivanovii subsp. ivanovii]MBC1760432.1 helicase-exonuclease AddAB subunit AddA [Listeria ivanovii]MBK3913787.1 helicase-exonuclease AddAB subunit AddA [Listeria ivanovii subsp. ivanovii]MBK3921375.1 helicase-exonuclease AddAB subunit AddA [Listeria ivanovii subsp. ivanovii]
MSLNIPDKPSSSTWTDDQWKAIQADGKNILVAAAAGSGKTAVLVTRIIEKLIDETAKWNVDELLIVTFTNASAAEMKFRIGKALEEALAQNPDSAHLKKQVALLNYASISTLHSFCLEIIRKHYFEADIDPNFRLIEPIESSMIRDEVLEDLLEEAYGIKDNDPFFHLVDSFTGDRTDTELHLLISKLYDFSRANPEPDIWLEKIVDLYETNNITSITELPYFPIIKEDIELRINQAKNDLLTAIEYASDTGGPEPYLGTLEGDLAQINMLSQVNWDSWEDVKISIKSVDFKRIPTLKNKSDYDEEYVEQTKKFRDAAKKEIKNILIDWFSRNEVNYLADLEKMKPDIKALSELVKKFAQNFFKEKQKRGVLDFNDLEHLALKILLKDGTPSEVAKSYQKQFKEVLIDEYQDTNMVQETILMLVTTVNETKGNLFMVGDVKQSIYRFRLAEPTLFMTKYQAYQQDGTGGGIRIDLSRNFRSRKEVLDVTNFIFHQLMDNKVAEIDYDNAAELTLGSHFPESKNMATELLLIDMKTEEKETEDDDLSPQELQKNQVEARAIALKVREMIDNKFPIYDKKMQQNRPIEYRDIVILARAMTSAPDIEEAMKLQDIPFYANNNSGYFETTEVATMIALLKVIDNPYQDIPLAAVLRSPIIGLTEEELGEIRMAKKKGYFFDALLTFKDSVISEAADKISEFIKQLNNWRELSIRENLTSLIWQIYQETNFYEFIGGLPGGKQRQANLRALYDRANQYEKTSFRGLFRFVRFVERLEVRGDDLGTAKTLGEKEDVVRMMTIHASKGLEFPVVIVSGLSKKFNMRDIYSKTLLDKDYGFASAYRDIEKMIVYPTIMQQAMKQKKMREMIAEEMRVLYVALTRAEEKLILTATVPDFEKTSKQWLQVAKEKETILPAAIRAKAKCYLDWIGHALIRHISFKELLCEEVIQPLPTDMLLQIEIKTKEMFWSSEVTESKQDNLLAKVRAHQPVPVQSAYKDEIERFMNYQYKDEAATEIRAKQSVTELKRQFTLQDSWSDTTLLKEFQKVSLDRPKFLQQNKLSATEIGTAMHTLMQAVSLENKPSINEVRQLLQKMREKDILTEAQVKAINIEQILGFFESELGEKVLLEKDHVKREVPFSYLLPVAKLYKQANIDEHVLIQGVVDSMIDQEDSIILIDYKTDKITGRYADWDAAEKVMKDRYQIQIKLYAEAIQAISGKRVSEAYLYFFDGQHMCRINTEEGF